MESAADESKSRFKANINRLRLSLLVLIFLLFHGQVRLGY